MSVWDSLVGQQPVIDMLSRIAQGDPSQIAQSWLICGPPGSGRSNMARAFAAALESPDHGMSDEPTRVTQQVLAGTHPDVSTVLSRGSGFRRNCAARLIRSPRRTISSGWPHDARAMCWTARSTPLPPFTVMWRSCRTMRRIRSGLSTWRIGRPSPSCPCGWTAPARWPDWTKWLTPASDLPVMATRCWCLNRSFAR